LTHACFLVSRGYVRTSCIITSSNVSCVLSSSHYKSSLSASVALHCIVGEAPKCMIHVRAASRSPPAGCPRRRRGGSHRHRCMSPGLSFRSFSFVSQAVCTCNTCMHAHDSGTQEFGVAMSHDLRNATESICGRRCYVRGRVLGPESAVSR
jgi:hypothetical protein